MVRTLFSRRELPCVILGLLSLLPLLALAAPAPAPPQLQQRQAQASSPVDNECGFSGDDNTYGLGIRIGVYLQWVTSAVAYGFLPTEAQSVRGVNNCFQAAMFAGLLFITITKGSDLYAVEAYMMLIFCMGGVCSGDAKEDGGIFKAKKFAYHKASNIGGLIRFVLSTGFCVYGLWFFFTGMDHMKHPGCSTWAYFFAKVNLYTWLRTFMKAVFVLMGIIHSMVIFWPIAHKLCCFPTSHNEEIDLAVASFGQSEIEPENTSRSKAEKGLESTSMVILSGSLISFMLTVELMIRWNHILGVNELGSTGQLLPLIMAIGSFIRVLHLLRKEGKSTGRSMDPDDNDICGGSTI
ncbi:uncharacterized protein H6S33_012613 [Morchella sextelata]|uniref:uncharacterized protein n=1 Tax=Morchella sextelata TaxID=1174677 RepID=UPI001D041C5A|nr:uncharacterized protein H6S33_012613 [Morchella sextelata]KAH0610067.1 hypothetical protein H6S33_012613 [Morchella sextelata]